MVLLNTEVGYNVCGVTPPIQGNDKYVSAVVQSLDREKFFWHLQQKVTISGSIARGAKIRFLRKIIGEILRQKPSFLRKS